MTEHKVVDGTDLILSVGGSALGFSTGCKITTTTETGERVTKEASSGKWKEKYVKSFSESISADGFVIADGYNTYAELKKLQLKGEPVDASYSKNVITLKRQLNEANRLNSELKETAKERASPSLKIICFAFIAGVAAGIVIKTIKI